MPVYTLQCPDCEHRFMGMVMAQLSRRTSGFVRFAAAAAPGPHPARSPGRIPGSSNAGGGCLCCGVSGRVNSGKK